MLDEPTNHLDVRHQFELMNLIRSLGLTTLAALQGRHWAVYPAIFWGLGLAMHGAAVWISSPRSALWTRMVDKELRAMQSLNKK